MADEAGGITDGVQAADAQIVGNEQWATDPGNEGPDPKEWDNIEARADTGFEPGEPGEIKGPDPAEHQS